MSNLNDSLPDLMRRATENLEPESTDLVERGMHRGAVLRRRRTALLSVSAVGAILATAGIVVGGTQVFGSPDHKQVPVAGTPAKAAGTAAKTAKPATSADSLATLRRLIPAGLQVSDAKITDGKGETQLSMVLNDGSGASLLTVSLGSTGPVSTSCAGVHGSCKILADGTMDSSYANESIFPYEPAKNPWGIKNTVVDIVRKNGSAISLYSYNAPKQIGVKHTRATPLLSVDTLKRIATSDQWVYPEKLVVTGDPANAKSSVPRAQTLQTLKQVLPNNPQLSNSQTWGGSDFNGAAWVANDGRGKARVDVLVTTGPAVTKCPGEGAQHCTVRANGTVLTWSLEEPEYSDGRQQAEGVLSNIVQVYYPDGRMINMTSYNAPAEKGSVHTRAKPIYTVAQLTTMADSSLWKFPTGSTVTPTK
jgi:hypothetical protein